MPDSRATCWACSGLLLLLVPASLLSHQLAVLASGLGKLQAPSYLYYVVCL